MVAQGSGSPGGSWGAVVGRPKGKVVSWVGALKPSPTVQTWREGLSGPAHPWRYIQPLSPPCLGLWTAALLRWGPEPSHLEMAMAQWRILAPRFNGVKCSKSPAPS